MGQRCTICDHPQADEIDARLLAGEPGRSVARAFNVTESALRRHRDNHRPQEAPGGPERPAAVPEDPDPASVARRRYEAEEEQRRGQRLAELERQERDRRDRAAAEGERVAAIARLRDQAAELAERRAELEDRAEAEVGPLLKTLGELEEVDRRHLSLMSRAGDLRSGQQPVTRLVQPWLRLRLGSFSPGGPIPAALDPHRGAPLRERDPLARTAAVRQPHGPPDAA